MNRNRIQKDFSNVNPYGAVNSVKFLSDQKAIDSGKQLKQAENGKIT